MQSFPKKQKASLAGGALEYVCSGQGNPTIVLLNGAGAPIEGWFRIYGELERLGAVLAYNRFGIGGNDKAAAAQTGRDVVAALRELLAAAEVKPPFVLVGYSLGGLYANLFARLHPGDVAGVVFLEATHPDDVEALDAMKTPLLRFIEKALDFAFAARARDEIASAAATVRQIAEAGGFPAIPIAVVTGGKTLSSWLMSVEAFANRQANQKQFLSLSPNAWQVVAARSGHAPQISEPVIVVEAVRNVLNAAARSE